MSDPSAAATPTPAVDNGIPRDSRLIVVFFLACLFLLAAAVILLVVMAAQSVFATRQMADFAMSLAEAWHSDDSMAVQIMPYVGVFVLAMTAPLRRTRTVFWLAVVVLMLIVISYQFLLWQSRDARWIYNSLIGTDNFAKLDILRSFFEVIRNGAIVLIASMLGLSVNKDAKN